MSVTRCSTRPLRRPDGSSTPSQGMAAEDLVSVPPPNVVPVSGEIVEVVPAVATADVSG